MESEFELLWWWRPWKLPVAPMQRWVKQISAQTQRNMAKSSVKERQGERKTDITFQWDGQSVENTGHWLTGWRQGGFKDFGGVSTAYLLFCQQTLAASDGQGWKDRIQIECRVYETDAAKRELMTLEGCQVFLLSYRVSLDGAGLQPGKKTRAKYGTFFVVPPLFTALRDKYKEGKCIHRLSWLHWSERPQYGLLLVCV